MKKDKLLVYIFLLSLPLVMSGCSGEKEEVQTEEKGVETVLPSNVEEVEVATLEKRDFAHELVSNGKVSSGNYADLRFRTSTEPVAKVYVKNGEKVRKGQKIAELELFTLQNKVAQAEVSGQARSLWRKYMLRMEKKFVKGRR